MRSFSSAFQRAESLFQSAGGRYPVFRQCSERLPDRRKRHAGALRHADDRRRDATRCAGNGADCRRCGRLANNPFAS
jgi:hypothetical protein